MKPITAIKKKEKIKEFFKGTIRLNEPLSSHTYIKIGGPADLYLSPEDVEDLKLLIEFLNVSDIPMRIIGKGSNLLVTDEALPLAVIELSAPFFREIYKQENCVCARAGVSIASFVEFAKNNGFSGSEFLTGIPGSIGGAVFMNAGVRNFNLESSKELCAIADIITKVEVMDNQGNLSIINREDIEFAYRSSGIHDQIIIAAWLELIPCSKQIVTKNIQDFLTNKMKTQDLAMPSAGCIFKNPLESKLSAGALIDQAKMKGFSIGDASVSQVHANFIVNKGDASFTQVNLLIDEIKKKVKNEFSVCLESEVEIWDKEGL